MPWSDSLGAHKNHFVAPDADDLNNWSDPVTRLIGDHYLQFTDSMQFWSDELAFDLGTVGTTPINANLGPDDFNSWADALAARLTLGVSASSGLNAWLDSLAARLAHNVDLSSSLNGWADALAYNLADLTATPINIGLGPDGLAGYSDTLALAKDYLVRPASDPLGSGADSLSARLALLVNFAADGFNDWTDSLGYTAGIWFASGSDLNQWADSLALRYGLLFRATDSLNLWSDTPTVIRGLLVNAGTDDLDNWDDSIWHPGILSLPASPITFAVRTTSTTIAQLALKYDATLATNRRIVETIH